MTLARTTVGAQKKRMKSVESKRYYVGWAAAVCVASGWAQETLQDAVQVVAVEGKRTGLMTAQQIKRGQLAIVDSVVADAIQALPDFSVTDALQRVTGVQIARDRGEGGNVAIRGLTQMETTLNGREVFTAGTGRNLDFADIPAEMVAGIDVYKSAMAEQIEGGLGGGIDLRTRRPLDFAGRQLAATGRLVHGELARHTQPQWSLLASERWRGAGGDEFGALLNLVHQRRAWREDQNSFGAPVPRGDLVDGRRTTVISSITESASTGRRERDAAAVTLQWRPAPGAEVYAEGRYERFLTRQDTYQITLGMPHTFVPGSVTLFDGAGDISAVSWTGAPASILSFARDTVDRNRSLAVGASWRGGQWSLKADLSHSAGHNALYFAGPTLTGSAAVVRIDLSGPQPSVALPGPELLDPGRLQVASIAYRYRPYDGRLNALRLDAGYRLDGWLESLSAGVRVGRRDAGNGAGLANGDAAVAPGLALSAVPALAAPYPFRRFFPHGGQGLSNYLVGDLGLARDAAALRRLVGLTAPLPATGGALGVWRIHERTDAAYVQARFNGGPLPLDGNAGLRLVRTRETVQGSQSLPSSGTIVPISTGHAYRDYLPSLNLRYRLGPDLYLRGAASKSLTRPDFNQLSPSLTLTPNSITPSANSGSAGNPALRPIRANNLDLALERYLGTTASATFTMFTKRVDGFIAGASEAELHDGAIYLVRRPYNTMRAVITGAELGYQQIYDFLPGWLGGLGLQANYTFVDSATPSSLLGADLPLPNLSRHSANLVGIYERAPWSARLAYNWRNRFLSGIGSHVGLGVLPVYSKGYGWLDASVGYKVSPTLTLSMEGGNLLRTVRSADFGSPGRPQSSVCNDRQVSVTASVRF